MVNRMGLISRVGTTFAIALMMIMRLAPVTGAAAQTSTSGVNGTSYISPSFGYSISWDGSWTVADEKVEDDYNMLQLSDDGSIFYLEGYSPAIDNEECLQTYGVESLTNTEGVEDLDVSEPEEADGGVFSDLTFTYAFEDNNGDPAELEMNAFVSCLTDEEADVNIAVTHFGVASLWDEETDAREKLLATLALGGDEPNNTDEPTDEDTPEADDTDPGSTSGTDSVLTEIRGDGELPDNADEIIALFHNSISDIDAYWTREFPILTGGLNYVPAKEYVPFTGTIDTACGSATGFGVNGEPGQGPFHCPLDDTVYLDINFVNYQFDAVGEMPFIVSFALAHEVGHHVQDLLGISKCLQTPCLDPNILTSLEMEYAADCYGGAWTADAELRGRLGSVDVDATIVQFMFVLSGDTESADAQSHGTGALRVWWYLNGYVDGAAKCYETSVVTKDWAQSGPPNPDPQTQADVEPTAAADEPTQEADEPTATSEAGGDAAQIGDAVETGEGTVTVTKTDSSDEVEGRTADGTFLIIFVTLDRPEDVSGAYPYEDWTLTDADGNEYELDGRATDALLSTAYEDGADEELEGGSSYKVALVFDVPTDAEGFMLINAGEDVQIQLDV